MSEHDEQVIFFELAELHFHRWPCLRWMYAIPNAGGYSGGFRANALRVMRMRSEGVRQGVPDVCLPVAMGVFHSLYIEMKIRKPRPTKTKGLRWDETKPTPEQKAYHAALRDLGHCVVVRHSGTEAWEAVDWYLRHGTSPDE